MRRLLTVMIVSFAILAGLPHPAVAGRIFDSAGLSKAPAALQREISILRSKFGQIRVISVCGKRPRLGRSGRRSYHETCRAVDFLACRSHRSSVLSYLSKTWRGGLIRYGSTGHIHIDVGPRIRAHKKGVGTRSLSC